MALITTKTGDSGMTQLNPGHVASKAHPVIWIMGDIDELSCALGMEGARFDSIQSFLSELMGYLYYKTANEQRLRAQIESMEDYISTHNNSIPPMFVNPRGAVNLARAICRRAERRVVEFAEIERLLPMSERYMNLDPVIKYFNRLSDYLFVKSFERASDQPQLFRDEMEQQIPLAVAA